MRATAATVIVVRRRFVNSVDSVGARYLSRHPSDPLLFVRDDNDINMLSSRHSSSRIIIIIVLPDDWASLWLWVE
jgi:hypothetical protein